MAESLLFFSSGGGTICMGSNEIHKALKGCRIINLLKKKQ